MTKHQLDSVFSQLTLMLDLPLSAETRGILHQLLTEGSQHNSPDQAAHMASPLGAGALAGQFLSGLHQGNLLSSELYPQLAHLQTILLQQFCDLFNQQQGHFTQGGSFSNLEALWMAREASPTASNIVYASKHCHYSVHKACHLLGLQLELLVVNEHQQMDLEALKTACKRAPPLAVVLTAGTTGTGQIDPIREAATIIRQTQAWLHIDAAWGGFLQLCPETKSLIAAHLADSICFDPHKSLGQPRPCGLFMYQQKSVQPLFNADYLGLQPDNRLPGSYGSEMFLPLWFTLQLEGFSSLGHKINSRLKQASALYQLLQQQQLWSKCSPTGIVCFKLDSRININELLNAGVFSMTRIDDQPVFRAVFAREALDASVIFRRLVPFL